MAILEKYSIKFLWKDKISFQDSLSVQEDLKTKVKSNTKAFFIGFECHPACITLGLRGRVDEDLNSSLDEYKKKQIQIVNIKRGGQATLHAPGQLVIYPIVDLLKWKIRPRDFLSLLEEATQTALKHYNIKAQKQEDFAGLFTKNGKIAFFGIHISQGVSQHGLAVNVHNDLQMFNVIRSCGLSYRPHDSFKNQGIDLPLKAVFYLWCKIAEKLFFKKAGLKL